MNRILLMVCLILTAFCTQAQKQKKAPVKTSPETLEAWIDFDKGSSYYTKEGLNKLDSIYMVAFGKDNTRFYKMTITGFDDAEEVTESNSSLARQRAVMVFKYFASREETEYIIKRTPSYSVSSCGGKQTYYVKYKMPFDFRWINIANNDITEYAEKGINPAGKVHIYVEEDQEDCLGQFFDYDYPAHDTVMSGYSFKATVPKSSYYYIHHTKDTLKDEFSIKFKDVSTFEELTDAYFLVPHKKQYIINAGYVTMTPSYKPDFANCNDEDTAGRNIKLEVYLEEQQRTAGLKFYAKTKKPNGETVYKALKTTKRKDKDTKEMWLECVVEPWQSDTVFLGKKIEEKDMGDYFYSATPDDKGSFECMDGWLRVYRLDKQGQMQMRDKMKAILRRPQGTM